MQKKHILVLSLLAAGIAIELILMAGVMARRGHSEQALSTNTTSIAWGENNPSTGKTSRPGETPQFLLEGTPLLDEDMLGAAPGSGLDEATPIFGPTLEGGESSSAGIFDGAPNPIPDFGSGYPAPGSGGSSSSGSGSGGVTYGGSVDFSGSDGSDEDFSLPPTQPAGAQEPWPTDVTAATEIPASTAPAATAQPAATNTEPPPWLPSSEPDPSEPTHTLPAATLPVEQPPQPTAPLPPGSTAPAPNATPNPGQPTAAATAPAAATAAPTQPPSAPAGLVSVPAAAPNIDGAGSDDSWGAAPAVEINVSGGANHGATTVTARSVYSGDSVYFLFTWEDPSMSYLRNPWEKQPDGSWKRLASPERGYNDENVYYEDKLALLWPVRGFGNFASAGCGSACHAGENADVKPYGNMYMPGEDGMADLWQWKSVRSVGQVDDQFLNGDRYSKDAPAAGFHPDPDDGGGYQNNQNNDKNAPAFMPPDGGQKNGWPGFITNGEKVEFNPNLFKPGERVPSILTAPWKGDRGDIQAAWQYKDGRWTLELRRKLMTGSRYDVQFDDPDKIYAFGIATFDNAQVRHAFQSGATLFRFKK